MSRPSRGLAGALGLVAVPITLAGQEPPPDRVPSTAPPDVVEWCGFGRPAPACEAYANASVTAAATVGGYDRSPVLAFETNTGINLGPRWAVGGGLMAGVGAGPLLALKSRLRLWLAAPLALDAGPGLVALAQDGSFPDWTFEITATWGDRWSVVLMHDRVDGTPFPALGRPGRKHGWHLGLRAGLGGISLNDLFAGKESRCRGPSCS